MREDFPLLEKNIIYFDNGATTLKPRILVESLKDYYYNYSANAHRGDYDISLKVDQMYENTRKLLKEFINAKKESEIIFTSGATDSLNKIIFGYFKHCLKSGDEKEIEVTFPEDYHAEDLKGAKVTFKVKVHEVKETQIPELDADFFEDLAMDGVDSKEKLEEEVKASIKARKDTENENKYIDALLEAAAKNVEVEIPDEMVHEEVHRMLHQYEDNLKMQGITLEQFYKYTNSNQEALEDQMKEEAKKRVLFRLMLEAIAKKENIVVTDEEADKEASELATKYNMTKEELLKNFGGIDMIKYDIEMRKTIDVLKK